jgi:hypothetical protein
VYTRPRHTPQRKLLALLGGKSDGTARNDRLSRFPIVSPPLQHGPRRYHRPSVQCRRRLGHRSSPLSRRRHLSPTQPAPPPSPTRTPPQLPSPTQPRPQLPPGGGSTAGVSATAVSVAAAAAAAANKCMEEIPHPTRIEATCPEPWAATIRVRRMHTIGTIRKSTSNCAQPVRLIYLKRASSHRPAWC